MNILIIGANGFTGRRMLDDLVSCGKYNMTASSLRDDIAPGDGYRFIRADIRRAAEVQALFKEVCPDVVINTSALSVLDFCETHHSEARATNVIAVEHLAHACEQYGSRFIHLSTDFVFDGRSECLYTEEDAPNPVNYYGVTKLEGEQRVSEYCGNYAIVRVVVVYGKALPGQHGNILQLVARLMHHPRNGIYHICGSDCVSIAEIAYRVADVLGLDRSLIQPVTTEEMQEATPRPRFSGLDIAKAKREINYLPHTLEEGIKEMFS